MYTAEAGFQSRWPAARVACGEAGGASQAFGLLRYIYPYETPNTPLPHHSSRPAAAHIGMETPLE